MRKVSTFIYLSMLLSCCDLFSEGLYEKTLEFLYGVIKDKAKHLKKWKGTAKTATNHYTKSVWPKLTTKEQLLFVLVRLRGNPSLFMLSDLFGISVSTGSSIFITWVLFLSKELSIFLPFATLQEMEGVKRPKPFSKMPCLRAIIDCTEIYIQKPSRPSSQRSTYSTYKARNTFKLFVSISPLVHINFISKLYSGCISDKEITRRCGFLEMLEAGDHVMADKGFNIQDLLAPNHATLIAPPIMHKGNVSTEASTATRRIASKRVHVERIMRRLKCFTIIRGVIPLNMKSYINAIISVCAALVNLQPTLIRDKKQNTDSD